MKKYLSILLPSLLIAIVVAFLMANVVKIGLPLAIGVGAIVFLIPLIFSNPELGLAAVAFFLPFERIPSFELGGASVKINYILIALVFFIYFAKKLASRELKIPREPVRYILAIFIISLTFSFARAVNIERSVTVFLFMVLMYVVYLTVTFMVKDKRALLYVLYGLVYGATFSAALGLFQFAGDAIGLPTQITLLKEGYDKSTFGFARVQATAIEPLYFANYLFIPLITLIVLLVRGEAEKIINKSFAYVLSVALLLNFVLTVSRGAYLGMAVAILALIVTQAKLILRAKTIITTVMIALVVLVGSYLALVKSEPRAIDEFVGHVMVNDREEGESVVSRVSATKEALQFWQESPWIGIGLANYGPLAQGDPKDTPEGGWFIVNNEYVELLAENGIVSLVLFFLVLLAVFLRAFGAIRHATSHFYKSILIGLSLALFAVLVQYASFSTIYIFHIWFLIALVSAISTIVLSKNENR